MNPTQTEERPRAATTCPTCGAQAERGQLICLECGSRISLAYRRPPSWRVPAAIVTVIVLAAAAGLYFAIDALTNDAEKEVAAQPAPRDPEPPAGGAGGGEEGAGAKDQPGAKNGDEGGGKAGDEAGGKSSDEQGAQNGAGAGDEQTGGSGAEPGAGSGAQPAVGAGGIRSWPNGADAFTVVILASQDRRSARGFARSAVNSGTPAGVLRADDYPALAASTGYFIVFVGRYQNQVKADRAAARLGRRYQGAYPQLVDGSKATG